MFDLIRKERLWHAWDNGLAEEIAPTPTFELKTVQDLSVYAQLRGASGLEIAEIGAGRPRVLPALKGANSCTIIDPVRDASGDEALIGIEHIEATIGDESAAAVPDESFDVVFSIAVIEHVPTPQLRSFHRDQLRILRPGGIFLHATGLYVDEGPDPGQAARFGMYRNWVSGRQGAEPIGEVFDGPLRYSTDLATNPDNVMYSWGKLAPDMIPVRQRSQVVSVIVAGRKLAEEAR